jgi:hypothetical protein
VHKHQGGLWVAAAAEDGAAAMVAAKVPTLHSKQMTDSISSSTVPKAHRLGALGRQQQERVQQQQQQQRVALLLLLLLLMV